MSDINTTMKRINRHVLFIRTTLHHNGYNPNSPICPECKSNRLDLFIHEANINIRCSHCFWEDNYMRIRKRGEGVI